MMSGNRREKEKRKKQGLPAGLDVPLILVDCASPETDGHAPARTHTHTHPTMFACLLNPHAVWGRVGGEDGPQEGRLPCNPVCACLYFRIFPSRFLIGNPRGVTLVVPSGPIL